MRTPSQQPRSDDGSIAPLIPIVLLVMLILGGLVVDGARDLTARGDAQGYAEEAARAGSADIDTTAQNLALNLTQGTDTVADRVAAYCTTVMAANPHVTACGLDQQAPYTAGLEPNPDCDAFVTQPLVVHTVVKMQIDTTLLGIVGVKELTSTGQGKARPYEGTDKDNAC